MNKFLDQDIGVALKEKNVWQGVALYTENLVLPLTFSCLIYM